MSMRWPTLMSQTLVTTRPFDEIMILVAWAAGIAASLILVPTALGVAGGGLAVLMIAIAIVDARRFIIPNELTAAALALGDRDQRCIAQIHRLIPILPQVHASANNLHSRDSSSFTPPTSIISHSDCCARADDRNRYIASVNGGHTASKVR